MVTGVKDLRHGAYAIVVANLRKKAKLNMKVKCKNCLPHEGIDIPVFTEIDKNILSKIKKESPIKTVKYLIDNYKLSYLESKYITTHINDNYGKCIRCNFDKLNEEYLNCPKCDALNLNWETDKPKSD